MKSTKLSKHKKRVRANIASIRKAQSTNFAEIERTLNRQAAKILAILETSKKDVGILVGRRPS